MGRRALIFCGPWASSQGHFKGRLTINNQVLLPQTDNWIIQQLGRSDERGLQEEFLRNRLKNSLSDLNRSGVIS